MLKDNLIQKFLNRVKKRYARLNKRQKKLIFMLIAVILLNIYINKVFKPQVKHLSSLSNRLAELDHLTITLQAQMPPIEDEKAEVEKLQRRKKYLSRKLAILEKKLPKSYRIPQLLGELAKQTSGWAIDFFYIKPKTSTTTVEEEYSRLDIEMQFDSPYYDFLGYINTLGNLSSYLNVTDIVVEKTKGTGFAGETTVTLVVSTLLSKEAGDDTTFSPIQGGIPFTASDFFQRNPLVPSSEEMKGLTKQTKYVLSGITFAEKDSTAIINDEIYRIGDSLDDKWTIDQILSNMVIIKHGYSSEVLTLGE